MTLAQMRDMMGLLLFRDRGGPRADALGNPRHPGGFDEG